MITRCLVYENLVEQSLQDTDTNQQDDQFYS